MASAEIVTVQDVYEAIYCCNGRYYKVTEASEIHDRINSDPVFAEDWFAHMESCEEEDALLLTKDESNSSDSSEPSQASEPSPLLELVPVSESSIMAQGTKETENEGSNSSNPGESTMEEYKDNYFWRRKGVLALIECYKEFQDEMNHPKARKKSVWIRVAQKMEEKGESVTGEMCDRKWRNLKKTYMTVKNNKCLSRRERHTWEYFSLLDKIFGQNLNKSADPPFTFSTMTPAIETGTSEYAVLAIKDTEEESASKRRKFSSKKSKASSDRETQPLFTGESRMWPGKHVSALIECYKQEQDKMLDPRMKKKEVWLTIAGKMRDEGIDVDGEMCDRKWRNLKITYKTMSNNSARHNWEFYDALQDVFGNDLNSTHLDTPRAITYPPHATDTPRAITYPPHATDTPRAITYSPLAITDSPRATADSPCAPADIKRANANMPNNANTPVFSYTLRVNSSTPRPNSSTPHLNSSTPSLNSSTQPVNSSAPPIYIDTPSVNDTATSTPCTPNVQDSQPKKRSTTVLHKYLETVNEARCSELKRLRESIEESNRLNREKNTILRDAQKERNRILEKALKEKNDILKELLKLRRNAS